jgi:hypothetical protein
MGVLANVVPQCQPAAWGGGFFGSGTEGVAWKWTFPAATNPDGSVINLSGVTGTGAVITALGGAPLVVLTFVGRSDGTWDVSADESLTAGKAAGAELNGGALACRWGLVITDGTDPIQMWTPANSTFTILKAA